MHLKCWAACANGIVGSSEACLTYHMSSALNAFDASSYLSAGHIPTRPLNAQLGLAVIAGI
jgi:hypothetical protein